MGRRLSSADRQRLRSLYRGEITYVDERIRDILNVLRNEDLDTRTIVAATSDHGEEFWDHGSVGHGHTVYNELVGVPLIFSCPGKIPAGVVRDEPSSLIDLVPTVLSLLDCEHSDRLPGIDLFANHQTSKRPRFIEGLEFFREEKAVVTGTWKLAYTPDIQRSRLFELSTDSDEIVDVSQFNEDQTADMIAVLERHQAECRRIADSLNLSASPNNMALTPHIREMLRAQGYLE
jgi:arylsulfatase A-like enzyme